MHTYEPRAQSNCPHHLPFVVQAFDGAVWLDSKWGGNTLDEAQRVEIPESAWIGGIRGRTRVVPRRAGTMNILPRD